jgi:hypothetical protein
VKEEPLPFKGGCYLLFLSGNISCPLWAEDGARHGRAKLACNGHNNWIRYLFNSYKQDYWNIYIYFLGSNMDKSLVLVGCVTT